MIGDVLTTAEELDALPKFTILALLIPGDVAGYPFECAVAVQKDNEDWFFPDGASQSSADLIAAPVENGLGSFRAQVLWVPSV